METWLHVRRCANTRGFRPGGRADLVKFLKFWLRTLNDVLALSLRGGVFEGVCSTVPTKTVGSVLAAFALLDRPRLRLPT